MHAAARQHTRLLERGAAGRSDRYDRAYDTTHTRSHTAGQMLAWWCLWCAYCPSRRTQATSRSIWPCGLYLLPLSPVPVRLRPATRAVVCTLVDSVGAATAEPVGQATETVISALAERVDSLLPQVVRFAPLPAYQPALADVCRTVRHPAAAATLHQLHIHHNARTCTHAHTHSWKSWRAMWRGGDRHFARRIFESSTSYVASFPPPPLPLHLHLDRQRK